MKDFEVNGNTTSTPAASVGWPDASCAASAGGVAHGLDGGEASSPPAKAGGRREAPALDLSLGHFGTSRPEYDVQFVVDGPYEVELNYRAMSATLSIDKDVHCSRIERRASMRKIEKLLRVASESGMRVVREVL